MLPTFPNVLMIFDIIPVLIDIDHPFGIGKVGLYVTENELVFSYCCMIIQQC